MGRREPAPSGTPLARLIPNALSIVRGLLAVPFALCMARDSSSSALAASILLGVAIASDLLDGAIARRMRSETALGRSLDHGADFAFVTLGLTAAASRGVLPVWLPIAIALAFTQYVVDSYWLHREGRLRMSSLGRWNGILYFVPLVGDALVRLGASVLAPLVPLVAWCLLASTLASMLDRALSLRRSRA